MLGVVLLVEVVDVRPGRPDDVGEEAPAGALRQPFDERRVRGRVDDVVEGVVRVHPARDERSVLRALPGTAAQLEGQLGEPLLGLVELLQAPPP